MAQRYQVEKLLGSGGMGSVWLGRHATLGQPVAIKFIHPELTASEEAMRRFETEAKAAARVRSRHAAQVIDHGVTSSGNPYIVMEYLEGETLDQTIRQRQRLPFEEVVQIVSQTARALSQAHAAGVVHRDLKPDNILLARERDAGPFGYTVKVVDFGIAKSVHDDNVGGVADDEDGDGARDAALHEPGGADRFGAGERGFRHLVARRLRLRCGDGPRTVRGRSDRRRRARGR